MGKVHQHLGARIGGYWPIIREIRRQGEKIANLGTMEMEQEVGEVRQHLYADGQNPRDFIRAFALIRELAHRTLGMGHYDVQLLGGWIMLRGMIAEMQTGEGKTLTATLPAGVVAMAGIPVHVVTVNDYLVVRDADLASPLYSALGLTVGKITEDMDPEARRAAYACDITYCTNKQLVFDYLKDRLAMGRAPGRVRDRMALLRTEGIPSARLLMRGLCYAIVDEVDSVLIDEARTPLILSRRGDGDEQQNIFAHGLWLVGQLREGRDFTIRMTDRHCALSRSGKARLHELASGLGGIWVMKRRREELVRQALIAQYFFERDKHYLVQDGKVQIIDEYTGRTMPDRSWEQGLHQMIEAKEHCDVTSQPDTLARISYQRFFRRYLRLAGMTGTAQEVANELWSVYRLKVIQVPTERPVRRQSWPGGIYPNQDAKWQAVAERVRSLRSGGRPVLVGTRSLGASEQLSAKLTENDIPHQVLNARQDAQEARIIAKAGQISAVTVATNMAGRGTDIKLDPQVTDKGGLHVIVTEYHDARRIDRQLIGRCGRQGDPGSFESVASLEDELLNAYPAWVRRGLLTMDRTISRLRGIRTIFVLAQKLQEWRHARKEKKK